MKDFTSIIIDGKEYFYFADDIDTSINGEKIGFALDENDKRYNIFWNANGKVKEVKAC